MGNAYLYGNGGSGGGGGSLGFEIVGGTTRPAKPTQNLVWVNTDVDITGYSLSATEPENPVEGMLWVNIADSSTIKSTFTVDKEWVTIYLTSTSQYINGVWVDVTAKSYQDGAWVDWISYLCKAGACMGALENGFVVAQTTTQLVPESGYIKFYNPSADGCISSADRIDVTRFSRFVVLGRVAFSTGSGARYTARLDTSKPTNYATTGAVATVSLPISTTEAQEFEIPVPSDGGEYYLSFTCGGSSGSNGQYVEIVDIILE